MYLFLQSNRYKDVLMPGYTHLQIAMPSSFGLWFGAYAESLVDDMMFLQAAYKTCNLIHWARQQGMALLSRWTVR